MLRHLFFYNIKVISRSKEVLFWTLIYPIILSSLFFFAFGNLATAEVFNKINIAVVDGSDYEASSGFYDLLAPFSDIDNISGDDDLFCVRVVSKDEGERLLFDGEISGYLEYDGQIELVVADSGLNQTIIKSFLDNYLQTGSTIGNIINQNPQSIKEGLLEDVYSRTQFLSQKPVANGRQKDNSIICYYALLAMTCLMGSALAVEEIEKIQANLSPEAARINVAPVPKFRIFLCNISAAIIFHIAVILIVLSYLVFVLGVDFGNKSIYIVLTCILGGITGVFFGTAVSVGIKRNGLKYAITVSCTMLSCFLSGMMVIDIKYIVQKHMPVLGYISPANLISDAFYSLYYFDGLSRYFANMAKLGLIAALLCIITCLVLRRKAYANL